jgi:hypothetical protein
MKILLNAWLHQTLMRAAATAAIAITSLTACGGGGDVSTSVPQASAAPTERRSAMPPERAKQLSSYGAKELFDWAQAKYPELLAGAFTDFPLEYRGIKFSVRSIPGKNAYLGLSADGEVYALAPFTNNYLQGFGRFSRFREQIDTDLCAASHPSCASQGGRAWQAAELLQRSDEFNITLLNNLDALSAIAPNGDVMVLWKSAGTLNGSTSKLFSRRYNADMGWWDAIVVVPDVSEDSSNVKEGFLLMDAAGNVTWIRPNGETRRFTAATGWGSPSFPPDVRTDLENEVNAVNAAVMDNSGNIALLVADYKNRGLYHHVLLANSNWGTWAKVDVGYHAITLARLAWSAKGTAMAVWRESIPNTGNSLMKAARYAPSSGWQAPVNIQIGDAIVSPNYVLSVRVAMDAAGNAIAAWDQGHSRSKSIYYNVSNASGAWGTVTQADNDNNDITSLDSVDLSMSSDGRALLSWRSALGVKAMQYTPGQGFNTPMVVAPRFSNPSLNIDDSGTVVMIYQAHAPKSLNRNIYSRRLTWGGVWSDQVLLESDAGDTKGSFTAAFNKAGQGVASWAQDDVANSSVRNSLWANLLR